MAGAFGFEPQPVQGSVRASDVGQHIMQRNMAQQPMMSAPMPAAPMPQVAAPEMSAAIGAAMEDSLSTERNGGTGARPKGPLAEGRLAALGVSPTEVALLKRAGVI